MSIFDQNKQGLHAGRSLRISDVMRYVVSAFLAALLTVSAFGPAFGEQTVPTSQAQVQLSFVPVVQHATPAVVNIYAKRVTQARRNTFMDDPFFERFFQGTERAPRVQNSLGSGVILTAEGIIVSNYHVVGMATDIRVVLNDRREYSARVLLGDQKSDLAILQLEGASDLPHLDLRPSQEVQVGELVLAIGNPFGVGQTVSSGIVSGLARSGASNGTGRGYFIQTDAPINPGNSGGALIDMSGRVIGINTRILSRSGGSNGIGFAIPADLVGAFVAQALAGNDMFLRPWAGLSGQSVDADMAETLGLERPGGIVISGMHPVSPFQAAGFEVGDVIARVDGLDVNTPSEMVFRMSVAGLGNRSLVARIRNGEAEEVPVELIAAPDQPPRDTVVLDQDAILEGMIIARVNPAVMSELNLSLTAQGVVVLEPRPLGARVGLRAGDVILNINDFGITAPADVARALKKARRWVRLEVLRGASRVQLRFRL